MKGFVDIILLPHPCILSLPKSMNVTYVIRKLFGPKRETTSARRNRATNFHVMRLFLNYKHFVLNIKSCRPILKSHLVASCLWDTCRSWRDQDRELLAEPTVPSFLSREGLPSRILGTT